jgi:hypothetical protein
MYLSISGLLPFLITTRELLQLAFYLYKLDNIILFTLNISQDFGITITNTFSLSGHG